MPFIIQWVEDCPGEQEIVKINTPVGLFAMVVYGDVIAETDWLPGLRANQVKGNHGLLVQLDAYWEHPEKPIPVKLLKQGSGFRNKVWAELCEIPVGQTITYLALARKINSAARAVGGACRDNPFPLLIPCHRVVAVSGTGGYCGTTAGEFLTIKQQLLNWEAKHSK